jgi:hypothetical protein
MIVIGVACVIGSLLAQPGVSGSAAPRRPMIKAAYFYDYLAVSHLDSLKAAGFDRALIKFIADTLDAPGARKLTAWVEHGRETGVEITPAWALQSRARLAAIRTTRRYTWGLGSVEPDVACPLDSLFWRSALLDRANEMMTATPGLHRLLVDLEIYTGTRHHYDAGPCRCASCLAEFAAASGTADHPADSTIQRFEEDRVTSILEALLAEFAAAHRGVEVGMFDLDLDSFVHRAATRALLGAGVPTVDYTERTYKTGGASVAAARTALDRIGKGIPIVGGVWLKGYPPGKVEAAARSILAKADGYFVFTTYSLWQEPAKLTGPYTLPGGREQYWEALGRANR